jgi:molybdate transport system ATP-binding protein
MTAALVDVELRLPFGAGDRVLAVRSASGRVAVVGPSGIGKSTLVRAIAGVEHRARGHVRVAGELWQDDREGVLLPAWQRRVGWVPQDARLFPHVRVRDNIAWGLDGPPADLDDVCAALEITGLLDRSPRNLSGGERQRVALARVLVRPTTVLLLDEPFGALDRALRARVIEALRARLGARPIVLVSHDERDLTGLVDDVVELG